MKRQGKFTGLMLSALLALGIFAIPAQANEGSILLTCVGTADVHETGDETTGITALESRNFDWEIEVECNWVAADGSNSLTHSAGTATLKAKGFNAVGRCGASTATDGTGTLDLGGHVVNLTELGWTSGGTVLLVEGTQDHDGGGSLTAQVQASGGDACADDSDGGGAKSFSVNIVGEALGLN